MSQQDNELQAQRDAALLHALRAQRDAAVSAADIVPPPLPEKDDALVRFLQRIIHMGVRALAVLMTFVIIWGVIDVAWVLYSQLTDEKGPAYLLEITDILATFGACMAVLIAIEIFVNITIYLRDDIIHVKIVMATALMAIARKVIIMDITKIETLEIFAIASVILALSIGYWLVIISHGDVAPTKDGH